MNINSFQIGLKKISLTPSLKVSYVHVRSTCLWRPTEKLGRNLSPSII